MSQFTNAMMTTNHGRTAEATEKEARHIIAEQYGEPLDTLKREDHLYNDLRGDSLDLVELVMTLEDEFSIEIPDSVAENWATVGQVIDYMQTRA